MPKKTVCDLLKEANRIWYNPSKLTQEELISLAEDLYNIILEMHLMAERMDNRLSEYNDFTRNIKKDAEALLAE